MQCFFCQNHLACGCLCQAWWVYCSFILLKTFVLCLIFKTKINILFKVRKWFSMLVQRYIKTMIVYFSSKIKKSNFYYVIQYVSSLLNYYYLQIDSCLCRAMTGSNLYVSNLIYSCHLPLTQDLLLMLLICNIN